MFVGFDVNEEECLASASPLYWSVQYRDCSLLRMLLQAGQYRATSHTSGRSVPHNLTRFRQVSASQPHTLQAGQCLTISHASGRSVPQPHTLQAGQYLTTSHSAGRSVLHGVLKTRLKTQRHPNPTPAAILAIPYESFHSASLSWE